MEDHVFADTSTEKPKVKVTYANRHKRRGTGGVGEDRASDASEGSENGEESSLSASVSSAPTKAHKRVDSLDLQGPLPRSSTGSNVAKNRITKKLPSSHNQTSSTDLTAFSTSPKSPSRGEKSLSAVTSKLILANRVKNRFKTPDGGDGMSEKTRTRTTEAERIAYFQNHPDVVEFEPHRALCRCCEKWLKLHPTSRYGMSAWKAHHLSCSSGKSRKGSQGTTGNTAVSDDDDDASSVAPSVSASEASITASSITGTRVRLTLEQRKQLLEQDELSGEVRESEVFCEACQKWIRLGSATKYSMQTWIKHVKRVHGRRIDAPSSRVQEVERKLQLVNDAQAKEFSASRVICKACENSVALSENIPYDLRNWQDHKLVCIVPDDGNGVDDKTISATAIATCARPPPSTASTEATFVDPSASNSSPQPATGQKRAREEEEGGEEEPRSVRQRTETYVPPDEKPPGLWGWFLLPWQTFKRGFAEGLWSSPNATSS